MEQSQYKSSTKLKYLARFQMGGRFGLLIGAMLIPFLLSFFALQLILSENYIINYILMFIIRILLSVLQVGASLIYLKTACNMPAQIGDLFYGFRNNTSIALKLGFLFVLINSICMVPCDIMEITILNSADLVFPEITETTTLNEITAFYSLLYNVMGAYSVLMLLCSLVAFVIKLVFVPAYYIMLDFPEWGAMTVLKKSIEVMRGNKMRYLLLQISFIPLLLLSVFTCGLTLIWVVPYMNMTNTNFYLDIMAVRNKSMRDNSY